MKYKLKNSKNYKQYDTRWAKLSYRVLPACMRLNGCGATALADIITVNKKYKDKTPKHARKWLLDREYVSANQGTYWNGIPACMKAHGYTDVKNHAKMSDLFKNMAASKRAGVILFRAGTKGGRTYTAGGHLCAIVGYKKVGSKHYLYICDPGPRLNDGWICYESEMRGLVSQVWSGKIPKEKKKEVTKKVKTSKKTETKKKETPKKEAPKKVTTFKGFDISYVQNGLTESDFKAAKKAGWDFVIIRLGTILKGALYTDKEFELKYKNAQKAGLKIGIYWYGMAKDTATAKKEAKYVISQLKGRELQYPVFYDIEDPTLKDIKNKKEICEAFCAVIEKAGYDAGVYASYDWLTNRIKPISSKYYIWLAQYPKATYKGRYEMHQYSSSGKVNGIGKTIDVNVSTIKPPEKQPQKQTQKNTAAEKIAKTAIDLAYKNQPAEAKYPTGKPTDAYKDALNKVYPDKKHWSEAPKVGASCDVFVGTVVRTSGVDPKYPRALNKQAEYLKKSEKFQEVKASSVQDLQDGDIIIYGRPNGNGHTCIYAGGKIREASLKHWYGVTTNTAKARLNKTGKAWIRVYRAK